MELPIGRDVPGRSTATEGDTPELLELNALGAAAAAPACAAVDGWLVNPARAARAEFRRVPPRRQWGPINRTKQPVLDASPVTPR
ncbi:hypothetical protein A5708_07460 [Mycobacterium colombiense]|uniref:Uncharacterized protein n=1 Tax=Mycobacterium colombiense TaxID=339268 RepID=A0A1A2YG22_9MYCO|nr:hypothetical protein A5708_07460 [Mycobacterium colombiense]